MLKRHWLLKALAFVLGLGFVIFGVHELQTDPTLRVLKTLSIADLERGEQPREDQYIAVGDAYLLGPYLVKYSHSRKHGDSAHVFAPLGSMAMAEQGASGKTIQPRLWVRIDRDFGTKEAASAAMKQDSLYQKPYPVRGVVRTLESDVASEMGSDGKINIGNPVALHDGSSPLSVGADKALILTGVLIWVLIALWLVADGAAGRWLQALTAEQKESGAAVFAGDSPVALLALVGAPLFLVGVALFAGDWIEQHQVDGAMLGLAALGLALVVWGLWRNRSAAVLGADTLTLARNRKRTVLDLSRLEALRIEETKVKGVTVRTYELHGAGSRKPVKVGSSLFHGGLDKAADFGLRLRNLAMQRLGPVIAERLNRGEQVPFGALTLSARGIAKGKQGAEVTPWEEIASADVKNGQLKIKQKGKTFAWGTFPVKKLLNFDLLMHVIESRVRA